MNDIAYTPGHSWAALIYEAAAAQGRPSPSADEAERVLWEFTAFPLAGPEKVSRQAHAYYANPEAAEESYRELWGHGDD